MKTMRTLLGAFLLLGSCYAQLSCRSDIVLDQNGQPIGGATLRVCANTATGTPCNSLATIWGDRLGTASITDSSGNFKADSHGNYKFCAAAGVYQLQTTGVGVTTTAKDVLLPCDPATSPCGGGSAVPTGTGFRHVTSDTEDAVVTPVPNCADVDGHLNYDLATNTFSCGAAAPVQTTVFIPGKAMPWIVTVSLNASFPFGTQDGTDPIVISGLVAGQNLTLQYLSGSVVYGIGTASDADGDPPPTGSGGGAQGFHPTAYMSGSSIGAAGLVGAFTDSSGSIIEAVSIGNNATLTVPSGATQLQLGTNDTQYNDNTGGFNIAISGAGSSLFSVRPIKTVAAAYTATSQDYTLLATGTFTVTLPVTGISTGQIYVVKNIGSGTITVSAASGNIDGSSSVSLATQYGSVTVQWNGTQWWKL